MNPFFVLKLLRVRLGIFLVKVIISNANWMEAPFPDTAHTLLKPGLDIFLRD